MAEPVTELIIPDVASADSLTAALAYAEAAGTRCRPAAPNTPDPWPAADGSTVRPVILSRSSPGTRARTTASRCMPGRSGAIIPDIDHPDKVPSILPQAINDLHAPLQSTRPDEPGRVHAVFACPPGRMFGNSTGRLGKGWGEIRGANGVIIVAPSVHPDGGCYHWIRTGPSLSCRRDRRAARRSAVQRRRRNRPRGSGIHCRGTPEAPAAVAPRPRPGVRHQGGRR